MTVESHPLSSDGSGGPVIGRRLLLSGMAAAALAAATGCSTSGESATTASCTSALKFPAAKPPASSAIIPKVAGTPIGWNDYPKPYTTIPDPPGKGGNVSSFHILWGAPPPAMAKNPWWQGLNQRLGVTLQPTLAAAQDYSDKLLTLAASGSFPDITYINFGESPGIQRTVSEGAFHDLTQYLSGDSLKQFPNLQRIPALTWKGSSFQGKLYGVPYPIQPVNGLLGLYRKDWAKRLGVDDPKSPDDVLEMFTAFHTGNPNGDGKPTYGMAELVTGLWNGMYHCPNNWRLDDGGSLSKDWESDEYREVLQFTQKLWKSGTIHPDTLTLTSTQWLEQYQSGKTGLVLGGGPGYFSSAPNSVMALAKQNDPRADSQPWLPPGHDGGKPRMALGSASYGFGGIPSSIKDEKRILELLHVMEYWAAPYGSVEFTYIYYGIEGTMFNFDDNGLPKVVTGDPSTWSDGINYLCGQTEINYFYPGQPGQVELIQRFQGDLISNSIADPTMGLYSPTWARKSGTLTQIQTDTFNSIAVGRQPMSYLDEAIKKWKSQGGDDARKEFQDALQKCASHG
jgi:putative aldouronate transport system substrate-binding protein